LNGLGINSQSIGNYENAEKYLAQSLAIAFGQKDSSGRQGRVYSAMGDALLVQDGREKEAIGVLQKSCRLLETRNDPHVLINAFRKIGEACKGIGAWDYAKAALDKSISVALSITCELDLLAMHFKVAPIKSWGRQTWIDTIRTKITGWYPRKRRRSHTQSFTLLSETAFLSADIEQIDYSISYTSI